MTDHQPTTINIDVDRLSVEALEFVWVFGKAKEHFEERIDTKLHILVAEYPEAITTGNDGKFNAGQLAILSRRARELTLQQNATPELAFIAIARQVLNELEDLYS
jgi:hypothetical protein